MAEAGRGGRARARGGSAAWASGAAWIVTRWRRWVSAGDRAGVVHLHRRDLAAGRGSGMARHAPRQGRVRRASRKSSRAASGPLPGLRTSPSAVARRPTDMSAKSATSTVGEGGIDVVRRHRGRAGAFRVVPGCGVAYGLTGRTKRGIRWGKTVGDCLAGVSAGVRRGKHATRATIGCEGGAYLAYQRMFISGIDGQVRDQ
jgi:hypothetical protein